ncbi:hypothetical protein [Rhodococcus sp. T7]|nr:hypothetical protein [Rhodococcus sp. T7]
MTEAGQSLMPVLDELADWARTHLRLQ